MVRNYPELARETKLRFHCDVCQLSDLLSKDFNTLWGYTKHQGKMPEYNRIIRNNVFK